MILRIGLDFDNTIANYDRAFPNVAQILGYQIKATNKRDLKAELIAGVEGETAWQKVQGLTYGRYIDQASLYPGVLEFIVRAKARDCEVFIISH
ncbi:MAG: phosphotransferase enzyme domain protein, partial [Acidimicrobiia bacterium]|nr:phosphotransferase enzyme domain protein [Acidimicrobiia bacterium]